MSRIDRLTPEQAALLPEYRDKWRRYGLSADPADRAMCESGITLAYKLAKLTPPRVVWTPSPLTSGITRAILARPEVWAYVRASVRDSVRDSVGASVWDSVWASVGASVRDSVWDSVWASVRDSVGASGYGQHDANWIGFYDYFRSVLRLEKQTDLLCGVTAIAKSGGWWLPHEKICWVSERHHICKLNGRGVIHCVDGPAIAYPDGFEVHAINGVRVPKYVIETPEKIVAENALSETNAEVRRVMIERMGQEKFLYQSEAQERHKDDFGTLYSIPAKAGDTLDFVKVVNSTPEPDGTFKDYILRVPPNMRTAREAVAWTFGKDEREYAPLAET